MVTNITSLTGNGLKDWLIQRVTAVYFAIYVWGLIGYLLMHKGLTFANWHALIQTPFVSITTIVALLMLTLHAWIGLWTVTTDYIKCTVIRVTIQMLIALFLLGQFIWGIMIFWGQA